MRNVKRIEGGGKGGMEPKQVYEKNLSFITGSEVKSSVTQGLGFKEMQSLFTKVAPLSVGISKRIQPFKKVMDYMSPVPLIPVWQDRDVKNRGTKLNP